MSIIRLIGNIIWFILGGIWLGIGWTLAGIVLCITVIGIPLGLQCFKAAKLTFAPFGKAVNIRFDAHPIANVLWAIFIGWGMALGYLVAGVLSCCTVVGIPVGLQAFKLMKLAFLPFGAAVEKV